MRLLVFLFSFYLMALAVTPCHDSVECSENRAERTTDHRNHASDNEQCPPFCCCACCGVQIAEFHQPAYFECSQPPQNPEKQPSFYTSAFPKKISRSIWQPPKIG